MDDLSAKLGPGFWSSPVIAKALGCSDFPLLLREICKARRWSQAELAAVVGYSQSWVSKVMRGRQELTLEQARDVAHRVGIPVALLRFGDGKGVEPAKRREFARTVTLALVPWPALPHAEEDAGPALTAITAAQRRLDAWVPARDLAPGVGAHVEMASRMAGQQANAGVAAALSEAAGFAGWLRADMCDRGSARGYYRLAVRAARRAGHDLLAGYMLGSLAWFEISDGDPASGLALAEQARQQLGRVKHPAPRAWLAAMQALGHAAATRDGYAADAALDRAASAVEEPDALTVPPPWPWIYPFDHAKLAGYRALVCVRLSRADQALAAFAESLPAAQSAPKQRAVIMLEVATAARHDATVHKDTERVDEAFSLASDALAVGARYRSERVIERSRLFRRSYTGPLTPRVRDFDRQLQAMLS